MLHINNPLPEKKIFHLRILCSNNEKYPLKTKSGNISKND